MTVVALAEATPTVPIVVLGAADEAVTGMAFTSSRVEPGDLFCCLRGAQRDGHDFAGQAVGRGAAALLVDHTLAFDVPQLVVEDTRLAMGPLAATFWGNPSGRVAVVGVTGTNGKTTTCALLGAITAHAGRPTGVIGTLTGAYTTPEAPDLQARLATLAGEGKAVVAMEVSSHGLAQHRVDGTRFALGLFTNLGRDHLDYHGTIERYFAAKATLFTPGLTDHGVINVDDVHGRQLADVASIPVTTFSSADARELRLEPDASRFRWRDQDIVVPMGGRFNVSNALAAATAASLLGLDDAAIAAGLAAAPRVPGRMESVDAGQPFRVVVDFAHTPDALAGLLGELRVAGTGRVIVVFGCGGDRDTDKRPLMGKVAAEGADLVVVTSDNPRHEDPQAIIDAVLAGVPVPLRQRVCVEADRRAAIALGLGAADGDDVVVVAGKGHETTQTVGEERRPFDDRAVAYEILESAG